MKEKEYEKQMKQTSCFHRSTLNKQFKRYIKAYKISSFNEEFADFVIMNRNETTL